MTGRAILDPATVPEDVRAMKVELIGSYAIRVVWSDGHDTGIYTFEYLKSLSP
jgi:ATP-binding protein involved in chromosome partitioning